MANVIKLRKGLDINLTGRAQEQMLPVKSSTEYALDRLNPHSLKGRVDGHEPRQSPYLQSDSRWYILTLYHILVQTS